MDDGGIIASPDIIVKVLKIIQDMSKELGMYLNESKTEVIWLSGPVPEINPLSGFKFKLTPVSKLEMLGSYLHNQQKDPPKDQYKI